ncbi:MAG: T9SS type A sorting domain-containing protein, partial [Candidatus Poribacteria bacterium]|nr:T9SS type A sorting domain-containing protein [Candidatus Poribacteria bacterium]
ISRDGIKSALVDKGRTIIASASGEKQAKIARSSSFSRTFFSLIERNQTIGNAFEQAARKMEKTIYHRDQFPQLESSGDGQPNQAEDYRRLEGRYLPANLASLGAPPNITRITPAGQLAVGVSSQRIEVELIGVEVSRVYATVIPPNFDPQLELKSWRQLEFAEFDLARVEAGKYAATYANFIRPGQYSVLVNAENRDGLADPVQTTITVPGEVSEPEATKMTGDVNGDGTVNIFDLVIAAGSFGKTGASVIGDVNADGSVNIFDLVLVASNFGQSIQAGPAVAAKIELTTRGHLTRLQKRHMAIAIDQLEANPQRSSAEEMVLGVLQAILPERLPTSTQLLANYPNPFNPETWIPFELNRDTEVTVTIYDVQGKQVRQLQLGMMVVGKYVGADRAAHWDGKAETGEAVSSGTYFYRIEAGDYTETRKMVILK